jgi:hypothetical protein
LIVLGGRVQIRNGDAMASKLPIDNAIARFADDRLFLLEPTPTQAILSLSLGAVLPEAVSACRGTMVKAVAAPAEPINPRLVILDWQFFFIFVFLPTRNCSKMG